MYNNDLSMVRVLLLLAALTSFFTLPVYAQGSGVAREQFITPGILKAARLSPNGKWIALHTINERKLSNIAFYRTADRSLVKQHTVRNLTHLAWSSDSQSLVLQSADLLYSLGMEANATPKSIVTLGAKDEIVESPSTEMGLPLALQFDQKQKKYLLTSPIQGKRLDLQGKGEIQQAILVEQSEELSLNALLKSRFEDYAEIAILTPNEMRSLFKCSDSRLEDPCGLVSYVPKQHTLYLKGRFGADLIGLYEFDLRTETLKLVHQDTEQRADLERVVIRRDGVPQFAYYRSLKNNWYGLNQKASDLLLRLPAETIANTDSIECDDTVESCLLVLSPLNKLQKEVLVWNTSSNTLAEVEYIKQEKALKVEVEAFTYQASDGMQLNGYLFFPSDKSRELLPLVTYPHGGPHSRDYYEPHRMALFLATRGYAVLKPNYRGSIGFGLKYMQCSNNDFGDGRVLQDILDATRHVKQMGFGKNSPAAIVGESFGGFSAVSAATFSSEFDVAIAGMPALDIGAVRSSLISRQVQPEKLRDLAFLWGDLKDPTFRQKLLERSPLYHLEKLNSPLYIWAGAKDPIVPISHISEYVTAQTNNQKAVSLIVDPRAAHGPQSQRSLEAYLYMMEVILGKYLQHQKVIQVDTTLEQRLANMLKYDANNTFTNRL